MGYRLACPARQARRLFVLDKKTGHMNVLLILKAAICFSRSDAALNMQPVQRCSYFGHEEQA